MKKLMVSYDCGASYHQHATANSVEELVKLAEEDENISQVRWCVEDEDGELEHLSPIHVRLLKAILNLVEKDA